MAQIKDVQIKINEINEISSNLKPLPLPIDEIAFGKNLSIGLGIQFNVITEQNLFHFYTKVIYSVIDFEEPVMELESEVVFEIKNISNVVREVADNKLEVDDEFLATIAGVCIGTIRGLLASITKGNPLAKFPLPILNPKEVLANLKK